MYQWTLAVNKKCRRDKQERAIAHKALIKKHKVQKKLKGVFNHIHNLLVGIMVQANNIQNRDYENIKNKYRELYSDQMGKQPSKYQGKKPKLTNHAKRRLWERFDTQWHSIEAIKNDIKKWWKCIRLNPDGKFFIVGTLGKYIMTKNFIVITILSHDKATTVCDASKKN